MPTTKFWLCTFLFILLSMFPIYAPLVFPIGYFSENAWGALYYSEKHFGGPFYPNQFLVKEETGDLSAGTGIKKNTTWYTDQYGYRNRPYSRNEYEIVILGDSFSVGNKLAQEETLSEVLAKKTGKSAYSFAPADINEYLNDPRFQRNKPRVVVFETVERSASGIREINISNFSRVNLVGERLGIVYDRLLKFSFVNYYKILGFEKFSRKPAAKEKTGILMSSNQQGMLFMKDSITAQRENLKNLGNISKRVVSYDEMFRTQNITFIFLIIPDKENVHYKDLPSGFGGMDSEFLQRLLKVLREEGVIVIDMESAFENATSSGKIVYQLDDSHWNEAGVNLTADIIAEKLRQFS